MLLGIDLDDAKEEVFVRMVVDGIALGVAFKRAGFNSKHRNAPSNLWSLPRIQERAAAILEARRTTGVVTLPQVTSMLQRVFSNAFHADEFNAAHNAALSLARLYGHVNDRQTLEVIRRPSRDPDAPSEQELSSWVESLPALNAPDGTGFSHSVLAPKGDLGSAPKGDIGSAPKGDLGPPPHAPAPPLSGETPATRYSDEIVAFTETPQSADATPMDWAGLDLGASDRIARDGVAGRPENGAPSRPVTGTPNERARSALLADEGTLPTPTKKTGSPLADEGTVYPSAEELF